MENTRTYGDACATAHALDLIGERWALLVVRELLFGPKRFTDLRAGLPNAGPNRLSRRLRELEGLGLVQRRKLAPPSGSWVYELTEWGRQLEPVLIGLGRWGRRSPFRDLDAHISVDALMLALRGDFAPQAGGDFTASLALHFGEDHFSVHVTEGRIEIIRGDPPRPDATIATSAKTLAALLTRRRSLDEATSTGDVTVTGDASAAIRLLDSFPRPESADPPRA